MVFIALSATAVVPSLHYGVLYGYEQFVTVVDVFWSVAVRGWFWRKKNLEAQ